MTPKLICKITDLFIRVHFSYFSQRLYLCAVIVIVPIDGLKVKWASTKTKKREKKTLIGRQFSILTRFHNSFAALFRTRFFLRLIFLQWSLRFRRVNKNTCVARNRYLRCSRLVFSFFAFSLARSLSSVRPNQTYVAWPILFWRRVSNER